MVEQQPWPASISQFTAHRIAVKKHPSNAKFMRISRRLVASQKPAAAGPIAASGFVTGKSGNANWRMMGKNAMAKKNGSAVRASGLING